MKIKNLNLNVYSYVADGLISINEVGEGRLIPAIILDVEGNQDLIDLLKLHKSGLTGDTNLSWTRDLYYRKIFVLKISFVNPMEVEFGIRFNIPRSIPIIDAIIYSRGLILQIGKKGDRLLSKLEDDNILIEVPDQGLKENWNKLVLKSYTQSYRKNGLSKKESKEEAIEKIKKMREYWKFRRS